MHSKINIHNFWRSHTFIFLMFVVMSVISSIIMWHYKYIGIGIDGFFHAQRIYDLRMSWNHGILFPLVSLDGYNQTGQAVMAMYPQMILYPMILLSYFVKSVVPFVYVAFILRNLFAFVVSYCSCYKFNGSKKVSFIFSAVYTLNSTVLCYAVTGFDVGRSASLIFLPLVLFGAYDLLNNNKWLELCIGMTMMIFSHVINSVIAIILICILLVVNIDKINFKKNINSIAKSAFICALITSCFWIPLLLIYFNNNLLITEFVPGLTGIRLVHILSITLHNVIDPTSISKFALIGLILSVIYYKKMSDVSKQMLWISIIFLLFMSNLFPWYILNETSIKNVLQFPWRFMIIPQLLLSYLFAETFVFCINRKKNKFILISMCVVAIISLQLYEQKSYVDMINKNPELSEKYTGNINFRLHENDDLNNLLYNNLAINDYYPANATSFGKLINEKKAIYNNDKYLRVSLYGNGRSSFDAPEKINSLTLPFLYYNGIDYQVKLDGKTVVGHANKHALMTINNVSKGKHHVQIIVHKTKAEIVSYVLSFIGLIILLGAIIKNFILKRKNK